MFGSLGVPELLFVLVIALLIFGPKRLPEVGRTLGKGLSEFRRATNELKRSISTELDTPEETPARAPRPAAVAVESAVARTTPEAQPETSSAAPVRPDAD